MLSIIIWSITHCVPFPGLDFYNESMVFVGEVFEDDPCLSLHAGVLSEAHQSPNRQHLYEKKISGSPLY